MKLFSLILLLLGLAQVVFSHSGRTDSKGGHWDRKAGTYHYHSQGAVPKPSVPGYPKAYSESFYQEQYAKKLGGKTEVTMPDGARGRHPGSSPRFSPPNAESVSSVL